MSQKNEGLSKSLISTIKTNGLDSIASDGAEIIIDEILSDGLLKDIPIVNTVLSLAKIGVSVREHIFIKKVLGFIEPLSKYSINERKEFLSKLDEKELDKVSSSIVLYLDKLDALEKAKMIGRIFEAYMVGDIKYKSLMYFIHFVDSVFILVWEDFYKAIEECDESKFFNPRIYLDDALALEKVGFYNEHIETENDEDNYPKEYVLSSKRVLRLSDAGWEFVNVVFDLGKWENEIFTRHRFDVEVEF